MKNEERRNTVRSRRTINREKMNKMSNEELAYYISRPCLCCSCKYNSENCRSATTCADAIHKWLESEVEE